MGGVLEQSCDDTWQPLAFVSRKLTETERRYSTYDRELTALFASVKYFKNMIGGNPLLLRTDHKPLIYAFKRKSDRASERQTRQLSFLAELSTEIEHVSGVDNEVADALSRVEAIRMPTTIDLRSLSLAQDSDPELAALLQSTNTALQLQKLTLGQDHQGLHCDVSQDDIRPFVPKPHRKQIFNAFHNAVHPSARATVKLICQRYVWPSMNKDVSQWCKACIPCQQSKVSRHVHRQPQTFVEPDQRFDHVHLDIVGPLPPSEGHTYCLTMIDRFSRWPEAVPLKDITANTVASAFYTHWVSRFGSPKTITTDQGTQFESALFMALSQTIGGKRIHTSPYHPAANGMIERWHRTLKTAIRCHSTADWASLLPTVLLGLRTVYKKDLKASPAEYLYGHPLRLPGEFFTHEDPPENPHMFLEPLRQHMRTLRPAPAVHHSKIKTFCHKDLHSCSHVFLQNGARRHTLDVPYTGPHRVVQRLNDVNFVIEVNGREVTVNIDRLKPAHLLPEDQEDTPATPPTSSAIHSEALDTATPRHQPTPSPSTSAREPRTYARKTVQLNTAHQ